MVTRLLATRNESEETQTQFCLAETMESHFGLGFARNERDAKSFAGDHLGRYRVEGELGVGNMGLVLAGYDPELKRRVALKVLLERSVSGRERLAREAQVLAQLTHPNIVAIYDVGRFHDEVFLAMELLHGRDLAGWLAGGFRTTAEILRVFEKIAAGIIAAHEAGIVHRDLKPSNFFVETSDRVCVADFGLATSNASAREGVVGTPAYMSPEQLEGLSATELSDQFSFCVALYEALCGRRPFSGATTLELRAAMREGNVVFARTPRGLPKWLREVLCKGLSEDPSQRFESMQLLLDAMRRARARHRTLRVGSISGAVAGVLALVVFAGTMTFQAKRIAAQRDRANLEAERANRESELARRTSEFMLDLFRVSDPGQARGNTVTAREILDQGAEKIGELADQPVLQAQLMQTMGSVYTNLGLHEQAEPLLKQSLAQMRGMLGDEHSSTLKGLDNLGTLYQRQGRYDEAEPLCSESLRLRKRLLGADHLETLTPMTCLATLYLAQARNAEAEPLFAAVLAVRQRELGQHAPKTLAAMNNLAIVYRVQGRYAEAEKLLLAAISVKTTTLGADHPSTLASTVTLGVLLKSLGRYDEAEVLLVDNIARCERVFGADHPRTLNAMTTLALNYALQERHDEAMTLGRETLASQKRVLGPDHHDTLATMHNLAQTLGGQKRYDEAATLFIELLATKKRLLGVDHPRVATTMAGLADVYSQQERLGEAETLARQSLAIRSRVLGQAHPSTALSQHRLANLLREQGDYKEAHLHYEKAQTGLLESHGPGLHVNTNLEHWALLLREMGEEEQALALEARITRIAR